jgi:cation transport ATPase
VLLWVGGLLALLAELPPLAVAVWTVNLINGVFSTWQEHRAERAVAALRGLLPTTSRVLRDGSEVVVPAEDARGRRRAAAGRGRPDLGGCPGRHRTSCGSTSHR